MKTVANLTPNIEQQLSAFGTQLSAKNLNLLLPDCLLRCFGGADRDRTGDPLLAKQVLSQLSYSPQN